MKPTEELLPTPRTDAAAFFTDCDDSCCEHYERKDVNGSDVSADFARTLERENAALIKRVERMREALSELLISYDQCDVEYLKNQKPDMQCCVRADSVLKALAAIESEVNL